MSKKERDLLLYGLGLPEEVAKDLVPATDDLRLQEKRLKQQKFLHAYAEEFGMILKACKKAEIHPTTVRWWKANDPVFAEAYELAKKETIDCLEEEAIKRAFNGSDLLLMFLMKKLDPSYRENATANIGILGQDFTIQFVDPEKLKEGKMEQDV